MTIKMENPVDCIPMVSKKTRFKAEVHMAMEYDYDMWLPVPKPCQSTLLDVQDVEAWIGACLRSPQL